MSTVSIKTSPRPLGLFPIGAILAIPLALLPLGAWLVESDTMVLAKCSFKIMLGIPCMGCGGTRATLNFLHGDILEALHFSPLVVIGYIGVLIWGAISLYLYAAGKRMEIAMKPWLSWTVRAFLISLPFANWFYLMAFDI